MKKKLLTALLVFVIAVTTAFAFAGCDEKVLVISTENNVATVTAGQSVKLNAKYGDSDVTPSYTVVSGSGFASIVDGELEVALSAENNAEIVVSATYQNVTSNNLVIKVTKQVTTHTLTVETDKTQLTAGMSANLTAKYDGEVKTEGVTYEMVGTCASITLSGNVATASATANVGDTAIIVAKCNDITSAPISITIVKTITADDYVLALSKDSVTADKNSATPATVEIELYTEKGVKISDLTGYHFEISTGAEASATLNGNVVTVTAQKHGETTLVVSTTLGSKKVTETCTVKSIVAPSAITAPSNIKDGVKYSYGMSEALDFNVDIIGNGACDKYDVTFQKYDGNGWADDTTATFNDENKQITFASVGEYKVIVKSKSGSVTEAEFTREISVNDGVNARTYEQLHNAMNNYLSQKQGFSYFNIINDLVLEPTTYNTPSQIAASRIDCYGDVVLSGNGYKIDASKIRILSYEEHVSGNIETIDALIYFYPYYNLTDNVVTSHNDNNVEVKDITIIGNMSLSTSLQKLMGMDESAPFEEAFNRALALYQKAGGDITAGAYRTGIKFKAESNEEADAINASCKNAVISNVNFEGFALSNVAGDFVQKITIENTRFSKAFASNCDFKYSDVSFVNCQFAQCGMAGVEFKVTDKFPTAMAGRTQKITFLDCDVNNWVDGNSVNMVASKAAGTDVIAQLKALVGTAGAPYTIRNYGVTGKNEELNFFVYLQGAQDVNTAAQCVAIYKTINGTPTSVWGPLSVESLTAGAQFVATGIPGTFVWLGTILPQ